MADGGLPGGGLGYLLSRATQLWRAEIAEALRPQGVTPAQFTVLASLLYRSRNPANPLMQREIADRTGMDPNTASQVIRSLTDRKLIRRSPHPDDGRAMALSLTTEGQALARNCAALARGVNSRFFAPTDTDQLARQLQAIIGKPKGQP